MFQLGEQLDDEVYSHLYCLISKVPELAGWPALDIPEMLADNLTDGKVSPS